LSFEKLRHPAIVRIEECDVPATRHLHLSSMSVRLSAIICAYNEGKSLPAAIHSLFAQTRVPDEIIVVNNASTAATRDVAQRIRGVIVVDEPRKGLVRARARGYHIASGDVLVYIDADCRAPLMLIERMERRFLRSPETVAVTGPYRFYDSDWVGVAGARLYDYTLAPFAQLAAHHVLRIGAVLYDGNFAVRRTGLLTLADSITAVELVRLRTAGPLNVEAAPRARASRRLHDGEPGTGRHAVPPPGYGPDASADCKRHTPHSRTTG
jgi:glycosyltransferase involved in cell wall biosynthesis